LAKPVLPEKLAPHPGAYSRGPLFHQTNFTKKFTPLFVQFPAISASAKECFFSAEQRTKFIIYAGVGGVVVQTE
jgi:hypothetical protein